MCVTEGGGDSGGNGGGGGVRCGADREKDLRGQSRRGSRKDAEKILRKEGRV